MLPFKRIICPTDFSDPSYEALKDADEIAMHFKAELILIHVVSPIHIPSEPVPIGVQIPQLLQEIEVSCQRKIDQVAEERISAPIKTQTMVILGNPAEEIVHLAEKTNADLIVIATHGLTGWRRFIFGSVAEKVVRLAPCPVLTICQKEKEAKNEP